MKYNTIDYSISNIYIYIYKEREREREREFFGQKDVHNFKHHCVPVPTCSHLRQSEQMEKKQLYNFS